MKNPIVLLVLGIALIGGSVAYEFFLKPEAENSPQVSQTTTTATTPSPPAAAKRDILTYVPSDTLLFFGGLESAQFEDMLKIAMPEEEAWVSEIDWENMMNQETAEKPAPAATKIFPGLFAEYMKALKNPDTLTKTLGLSREFDGAIYTVGAIPVFRASLSSEADFLSMLDRAELQSKVTHKKEQVGDLSLRLYSFGKDASSESDLDLVITTQNNYAIVTVAIPEKNRQSLLEHALGIAKPDTSLADTSSLNEIKDKYNFHPAYIGYIDHVEIVKGLTNPQSNRFGDMLEGFIQTHLSKKADTQASTEHPMANIQTAACQKELVDIAQSWPRSVMGYTKIALDQQPKELKALGVIEVNDGELLTDLRSLRGYVPPHFHNTDSKAAFGLGLGFNMDALLPFLTKTFQNILQTPYECAPLKDMKQQLAASNGTAALGMVSGMLAGLQGVSATVFDIDGSIDLENKQPNINSVDAMITISAANPQSFLMMVKNFAPPLAGVQIPSDGSAIDLPVPLPLPMGESPKIAIKGKHIVAYLGKKGEDHANKLSTAELKQNAILAFDMNYGKYLQLLSMGLEEASSKPENADQKKELEAISNAMGTMNVQVQQIIDIGTHGISAEANTIVE